MNDGRLMRTILSALVFILLVCRMTVFGEPAPWWNAGWRFRTTITNNTPSRDDAVTPTEVAGGRAVTESLRRQIQYASYGDNMKHLRAFARSLYIVR